MLRPILVALFAIGLARAQGLVVRGTAVNSSHVALSADLTLGSPGEVVSILPSRGADSAALTGSLQFHATGAHNRSSFPDGTWYDYNGGTFSITGSTNGAPPRVLVSGGIVKGHGGTENASGKLGPVLYVFYATEVKLTYVDPSVGTPADAVSFRTVQTFARSKGSGGRVTFDGSKTVAETQVFGLKGPRSR